MDWSERENIDCDDARTLVFLARDMLDRIREEEPESARRLLAIAGYPVVRTDEELTLIVRTLRKAAYPGRTSGIY